MRQIERKASGEKTYGSENIELADLSAPRRSLLSAIFHPSEDPISFSGSGAGHQISRAFWALVLGSTVVGGFSIWISNRMVANGQLASERYAQKYDLEIREQTLVAAQATESLLNILSDESKYTKDEKTRKVKLTDTAASEVTNRMSQLSESWPGYANSYEVKLVSKLATEGLDSKDIYKAYDGLVRRQKRRVDELKFQPIDGAVSDLKENFPRLPNLDNVSD